MIGDMPTLCPSRLIQADVVDIRTAGNLSHYGWHHLEPVCDADLSRRPGRPGTRTPLIPRKINALPIGHRWDRVPGVTLLGDAAHVMSPFAGDGTNLAMLDGAALGQAIAVHPDDPEKALTAYEEARFPRSAEKAQGSAGGIDLCLGPDLVASLVALFTATPEETA